MASEFFLYIFSNWCVFLAGCMILKNHLGEIFGRKKQQLQPHDRLTISRDTEILLLASTIARTYWCCSPPELWAHDPNTARFLCVSDLVLSCILWTAVVTVGLFNRQQYRSNYDMEGQRIVPIWAQWPAQLLISAGILSPILRLFVNDDHENIANSARPPFPLADYAIMLNMTLDTMAMIPQMFVISRGEEDMCSRSTGNVVGLMGAARMFRMCFWVISMVINYLATGGYILWYFILPDFIHTLVMGEYVWLWAKRLRSEAVDLCSI